jgi:hypothetical protein
VEKESSSDIDLGREGGGERRTGDESCPQARETRRWAW